MCRGHLRLTCHPAENICSEWQLPHTLGKHLLTRDQASVQGSFEANLPPRAGSAHCYAAAALGSWTNKGSRRLANSLKWHSGASTHDDSWRPEVRALLLSICI